MPDSLPRHPALMLRDLLVSYWDETETSGLDPDVAPHRDGGLSMNRGWYDTTDFDPHCALTGFREDTDGGGDTGYTGIDPSGAGPTQTRIGQGSVTIFAEADTEYGTEGMTADAIVNAIQNEVEDVVGQAMSDDYPNVELPKPWTNLSSSWDREDVDRDVTPVVRYSTLRIRYAWERLPR